MINIEFSQRLTEQQFLSFLNKATKKKYVSRKCYSITHDGTLYIDFVTKDNTVDSYMFRDDRISCRELNITNTDWMIFLRQIFGETYLRKMGLKDIPNPFISQLMMEEVKDIFMVKYRNRKVFIGTDVVPYIAQLREVEPLLIGTRRFKVSDNVNRKMTGVETEFVLSPLFDCHKTEISEDTREGFFLRFMVQKFGKPFIDFYLENMMQQIEDDIETFTLKKLNEFKITKSYAYHYLNA